LELLPSDPQDVMVLHPDGPDVYDRFRIVLDIVKDTQAADSEFPGSERIN
jgi:hypothetical protein